VSTVSKGIDQFAGPTEEIASFWPGYMFASQADPYPGFENHSGWNVTNRLTVDQTMKYHILAENNIVDNFRSYIPRIAVLGNQWYFSAFSASDWARILHMNGYTAAITVGDASVFLCCSR
jgi:hypothetical protein